jgi:hypothetical protein
MRTSSNDSNQAATLRVTATADMSISVIPVRVQPTDTPTAQSRSEESSPAPLSSMASLRGPQARSNSATVLAGINCAPSVNVPTGIRFPHNSKKWQLGVGKCPGEATLEGIFAMGTTHLNSQAWAHNGIPDGSPGCQYINSYHSTESPARWVRMAPHGELANCKLRTLPASQGGGAWLHSS